MMYHIEREIAEQPTVIRRLLAEEAANVQRIAQAIRAYDPAFVLIAARGTSDNAARYAQYLLGVYARLPVALAAPSIHTLYGVQPRLARTLVIGVSQSGKSTDVLQVVQDARAQGALTLSITNDDTSPMAQAAAYHLWLRGGAEISVAATKTYTAQLTAIALLTAYLADTPALHADLPHLADQVEATLQHAAAMPAWVQRYRYAERMAAIGRGYNYCTAFEIAQKIKELCYMPVEQYSEADFRHGPIAMVAPGFPVLVIAPSGQPQPLLLDLLAKLRQKQAECLVISDDPAALAYGVSQMPLPAGIPEWLSPVCAVIPGQFLAMHLALAKGHSVDKPEGLNKVTITR